MKKECSDFEILISAAIDGELEPSEFAELERHVDLCGGCRGLYQKFETVNDFLVAHDCSGNLATKQLVETSAHSSLESMLPVNGHSSSSLETLFHAKPSPAANVDSLRGRTFLAGGVLAAAAAGLAALLTAGPTETKPVEFPFADISLSVEKVNMLNEQSHSIQASQTKAIEQELRTLTLMAQNTNGNDDEIELIESKIESLKRRVQKLNDTSLKP